MKEILCEHCGANLKEVGLVIETDSEYAEYNEEAKRFEFASSVKMVPKCGDCYASFNLDISVVDVRTREKI